MRTCRTLVCLATYRPGTSCRVERHRTTAADHTKPRHRTELIAALMLVGVVAMRVWGASHDAASQWAARQETHSSTQITTTWKPMHESAKVQNLVHSVQHHMQLDQQLQTISRQLTLPRRITVNVQTGVDGPAYDASRVTVDIPYAYIQEVHDTLKGADPETSVTGSRAVIADAVTFIILHEIAHAIIDTRQLVVTGREEDAADVLAVVLAVQMLDRPEIAVHGAQLFAAYGAVYGAPTMSQLMDEHLVDQQRAFGIACLAFGSHPLRFAGIMDAVSASAEQRAHCRYAYARAASSWKALLG